MLPTGRIATAWLLLFSQALGLPQAQAAKAARYTRGFIANQEEVLVTPATHQPPQDWTPITTIVETVKAEADIPIGVYVGALEFQRPMPTAYTRRPGLSSNTTTLPPAPTTAG